MPSDRIVTVQIRVLDSVNFPERFVVDTLNDMLGVRWVKVLDGNGKWKATSPSHWSHPMPLDKAMLAD
jgi:hypothetical protein